MAESVLAWPVTRFDADLALRWGVRPDVRAGFPTAEVVQAACDELGWPLVSTTISYAFGRRSYSTWVGTVLPFGASGIGATTVALAETSYRFELGSLAAVLSLTRVVAATCGPQVLAFTSGGAHVVVGGGEALADVKAAFATARESALAGGQG